MTTSKLFGSVIAALVMAKEISQRILRCLAHADFT